MIYDVLQMRERATMPRGEYDAVIRFKPTWFESFLSGRGTTFQTYRGSVHSWWEIPSGDDATPEIAEILHKAWRLEHNAYL